MLRFTTGSSQLHELPFLAAMKLSSTVLALAAGRSLLGVRADDKLVPLVFKPLPLGSIRPAGWLQDQLQLMADGLAGHEHDFYDFVAHSSWLGGNQEYSDLNEGFPYWFNGLVPLAYQLDNARLKQQVTSAAQTVFDRQQRDGWLGPEQGTERNFWARYPFFLGLTQLAEADHAFTEPVVSHLHTFMALMNSMMSNNYTGTSLPVEAFGLLRGLSKMPFILPSMRLETNTNVATEQATSTMMATSWMKEISSGVKSACRT